MRIALFIIIALIALGLYNATDNHRRLLQSFQEGK